jgi:hypothetical protein
MVRRRGWALMVVAACLAVAAPAAAAPSAVAPEAAAPAGAGATRVVAYVPHAKIGPVLTGDAVAWGEGREAFSQRGSFALRVADAARSIRAVLTVPTRPGSRPLWTRLLGGAGGLVAGYDIVRDHGDPREGEELRSRTVVALTPAGRRTLAGTPLQLSATTLLVDRSEEGPIRLEQVDLNGAVADRDVTPKGLVADAMPGVKDARIAGDFIAVSQEIPGEDLDSDVVISLFRRSTGARIYAWPRPPVVWTIADLAPDGRLLLAEQLGAVVAGTRYRLHVVDPVASPKPRLIAPGMTSETARIVGNEAIGSRAVGGRGAQPTAFPLAGGAPRPLGAPVTRIDGLDATAETVAWRSDNGCVLRAPLAAPAEAVLPPGACPRAALTLPPVQGLTVSDRRVLRIGVGCPGAPPPGCRGTVTLRLVASRRGKAVPLAAASVAVAPGTTKTIELRLSRSKTRIAARRGDDGQLRAAVADPEGHTRTTTRTFFLTVPGTPPI